MGKARILSKINDRLLNIFNQYRSKGLGKKWGTWEEIALQVYE